MNAEPKYLIQYTPYCGDLVLWWRAGRSGYTTAVDEAGRYTADEARSIEQGRDLDRAWPEDLVLRAVRPHVQYAALAEEADASAEATRLVPVPPSNACRMCGAPVAWSPLCSACLGVVERVREAIAAERRTRMSHADICARLECVRSGSADSAVLDAALDELERRDEVTVYGRDRDLVSVRRAA